MTSGRSRSPDVMTAIGGKAPIEQRFSLGGGAAVFLLRRALQAVFVIFGVVCVTFFVLRLVPGDPARLMVPPGSSEEVVAGIRQQLGTNRPILDQFWIFLSGLFHGDLGRSFRYERPVLDLMLSALPA